MRLVSALLTFFIALSVLVPSITLAQVTPASTARYSDRTSYCGCLNSFGGQAESRRKAKINFCSVKKGVGVFQTIRDTETPCPATPTAAAVGSIAQSSLTVYCALWYCDSTVPKGKVKCDNGNGGTNCDAPLTNVQNPGGGSGGSGSGGSTPTPPPSGGGSSPIPSTPGSSQPGSAFTPPAATPAPTPTPAPAAPSFPSAAPPADPAAAAPAESPYSGLAEKSYQVQLDEAIAGAMAQSKILSNIYSRGAAPDFIQGGETFPMNYTVHATDPLARDDSSSFLDTLVGFAGSIIKAVFPSAPIAAAQPSIPSQPTPAPTNRPTIGDLIVVDVVSELQTPDNNSRPAQPRDLPNRPQPSVAANTPPVPTETANSETVQTVERNSTSENPQPSGFGSSGGGGSSVEREAFIGSFLFWLIHGIESAFTSILAFIYAIFYTIIQFFQDILTSLKQVQ